LAQVEVKTEVAGTVWKIVAAAGQRLEAGDPVMIIECMKMEIPVVAEAAGTVAKILVAEAALVAEGQPVAILETPA